MSRAISASTFFSRSGSGFGSGFGSEGFGSEGFAPGFGSSARAARRGKRRDRGRREEREDQRGSCHGDRSVAMMARVRARGPEGGRAYTRADRPNAPPMPSLRIDVAGQQFVARPPGVVRIGRDVECDLRIDDPSVGAMHASLEPMPDGGRLLKDGNSGRPTKVNGTSVKRVVLAPGDVVEIGPARIVYVEGAAAAVASASPRRGSGTPSPRRGRSRRGRPSPRRPPPPVAPPPPSVPQRAAAPVAPLAAASPPAVPTAPAPSVAPASPAPVASASPAPRAPRRSGSSGPLTGTLVGLGTFALIAGAGAWLLGRSGDPTEQLARRRPTSRRRRPPRGRAKTSPARSRGSRRSRRATSRGSASTRSASSTAGASGWPRPTATCADLVARGHRLDAGAARSAFESLSVKHGTGPSARHADALDRMAAARAAWVASGAGATGDAADAEVEAGRFAAAAALWDAFERGAPSAEETRVAVDAGRGAVAAAAARGFDDLRAAAEAKGAKDGPVAAATTLRDRAGDFAGTPHAAALHAEAAAWDEGRRRHAGRDPRGGPARARGVVRGARPRDADRPRGRAGRGGIRDAARRERARDEGARGAPPRRGARRRRGRRARRGDDVRRRGRRGPRATTW